MVANYVVLSKFSTSKICDEVSIGDFLGIQGTPLGDFMYEYMSCKKAHIIPASVRKALAKEVTKFRGELKKLSVTYWPNEQIRSTHVFFLADYFANAKKLYEDFCKKYNDMLAEIKKNERAYILKFLNNYSAVIAKLNNSDKRRLYNALKAEVDTAMSKAKYGTNLGEVRLPVDLDAKRIFLKKMHNIGKNVVSKTTTAIASSKPLPADIISEGLHELENYNKTLDSNEFRKIISLLESVAANPSDVTFCANACTDIGNYLDDVEFAYDLVQISVK